jgi:hypothetical protein
MAATALVSTGMAWAEGPQVGVAGDETTGPTRDRLIQELSAQGYDVKLAASEMDLRASLSARLMVRERRIEVTVVSRRAAGFERREAIVSIASGEDVSTAITRAMEFLRASLIEVQAIAPAIPAPPTEKKERTNWVRKPIEPARPALSTALGLGAGALRSIGGLDPNGMIVPWIGWHSGERSLIRLQGMIPQTTSSRAGPEGQVSVRPGLVGLVVSWAPWNWTWLRPEFEAGLHVTVLSIGAQANEGYIGHDKTRLMLTPLIGAGIVAFPGRLQLRLTAVTGTAVPRERMTFGGREAARWGEWLAGAMATIEVKLDG